MRKIETCLSPELIDLHDFKNSTVVVVDIFRASSTIVTALSNGVESIIPVDDLEVCRAYKKQGVLIAGERNGKKAKGFDLGNSPLAYLNNQFHGAKIAMTTTNGTLALSKARKHAGEILIGSFLNIASTVKYIKANKNDVLILCAGWKGKFNIEDALYAGALSNALGIPNDCDATLAMESLYLNVKNNIKAFLQKASHAKRLQNHHLEEDIDFCLDIDRFNTVVKLNGDQLEQFP